jgi:fructose-1-phosphate kinase PfkB-like protein
MELARQEGLMCEGIAVEHELRTCLTIVDPSAGYRVTELYEQGAPLEAGAWERLIAEATRYLTQATFLAVCGSFLPETPSRGLYDLMSQANSAAVPVLLDTYGSQLTQALELGPALLKINQFEAGELVGQHLTSPAQAIAGAAELQRRGAKAVVITLGKQGAVGLTAEGQSFAWAAPEVAAICPTGSGDCLFAGIAAGLVRGQPLPEAVRMGIAAGAANTLQIGAGRFDFAQVQQLFEVIQSLALNNVG